MLGVPGLAFETWEAEMRRYKSMLSETWSEKDIQRPSLSKVQLTLGTCIWFGPHALFQGA